MRYAGPIRTTICAVVILANVLAPSGAHAATEENVGIATSASLTWMNPKDLNSRLDDIKKLGAQWVRVDFDWSVIQPKDATHYHWNDYDRVVNATTSKNIKILALVDYTPAWARQPACRAKLANRDNAKTCRPRSDDEFAKFAGEIAHRYKGKSIRGWEIWNEPNMIGYWKTVKNGSFAVEPLEYARLANASAQQIRYYNNDAKIITGGLSPLFEPSPTKGMRQSDYLAAILPHLNKQLFDAVGIHPYSWPVMPEKAANYNAFYTVDHGSTKYNLLSIMHRNGWEQKQVWATEYGASTKGQRLVTRPTPTDRPDHVSENAQAQMVYDAILLWSTKPFAGPIFIHSDSDKWLASHKNEGGYGLRRADGTPKPAYSSLQKAVVATDIRRALTHRLPF